MKDRCLLSLLFIVVVVLGCFMSTAARTSDIAATRTLAQANAEKARAYYAAGDTAMKAGDVLTAVVEWGNALRLKPSSTITAKALADAAAKLGDDGNDSYAHLISATDMQAQGKLDDAGKELGLALNYHPNSLTPQCLTAKALELADLQKIGKLVDTTDPKPTAFTDAAKQATITEKATASTSDLRVDKPKREYTTSKDIPRSEPNITRIPMPRAPRMRTYGVHISRPPIYHPSIRIYRSAGIGHSPVKNTSSATKRSSTTTKRSNICVTLTHP